VTVGARRLALAAAAVVAGLALGVVWLATRGDDEQAPQVLQGLLSVRADVEPRVHGFADPVTAEVVVLADPSTIVADSIRIDARLEPYELEGPVEVDRDETPSLARVRFRYPLSCRSEACAPAGDELPIELRFGRVLLRVRGRGSQTAQDFQWPVVRVTPRVDAEAVERGRWRADETTLPEPGFRVPPTALAGGLALAAAALVAFAASLGARLVGGRAAASEVPQDARPPLEQALELARLASRNGDVSARRQALERVARELSRLDHDHLAERASTLAWSPSAPSADAIEALARDAEAAVGGRL
jgi:hypothetical protein